MARFTANSESFEEEKVMRLTRSMTAAKRGKINTIKPKQKPRPAKIHKADEAGKKHKIEQKVTNHRKKKPVPPEAAKAAPNDARAPPCDSLRAHKQSETPCAERLTVAETEKNNLKKPVQPDTGLKIAIHPPLPTPRPLKEVAAVPIVAHRGEHRAPLRIRKAPFSLNTEKRTVYIANLLPGHSDDVEKKVRQLFADCGPILRVCVTLIPGTPMYHEVHTAPHRAGAYQCWIEFLLENSAASALKKHLRMFDDRQLVVCRTARDLASWFPKILKTLPTKKTSPLKSQETDIWLDQSTPQALRPNPLPTIVQVESKPGRFNFLGFSFGVTLS